MAKGNRNYVMSGKVGNSVLYKLTDSNNKDIQGERTYVAKIANPKTVAQCIQRVKMDPAVRFYRAFKEEILDHSFEGVKYGGKSHNRFSKLALMMKNGFPFCTKDENVLAPGNYVMAEGSLNQIPFEFTDSSTVKIKGINLEATTVGALTNFLVANFPYIKNGDQLTFAFVTGEDVKTTYPIVQRIILNADSTQRIDEDFLPMVMGGTGEITIGTGQNKKPIFGAAIILSRPSMSQTSGTVTWLRSNSRMVVNTENSDAMSQWFTNAKYQEAVTSYMKSSKDVSSDWYLNQGKLDNSEANIPNPPVDPADVTVSASATADGNTVNFPAVGAADEAMGVSEGDNVTINVVTNAPDQVSLYDTETNLNIQTAKTLTATGFTMSIAIEDISGVKAGLRVGTIAKTGAIEFSIIVNP